MCNKCAPLDKKIEHYEKIAVSIGDRVTVERLMALIADLRFWQRVCGSIERRLSLVSFFGGNLAAAAFGTFETLSPPQRTCPLNARAPQDPPV
jgi:hypothetical protein